MRRLRSALRLPQTPHGDTRREQRGLRVFGAIEHHLRAALRERPEVDAGAVGRLGKRLAHLRMQFAEFGEHADRLRALSRKNESEIRHRLNTSARRKTR
jgi:hypothetical protein